MKRQVIAAVLLGLALTACTQKSDNNQNNGDMNTTLNLTQEWDKTFPKSDKVDHKKVTFRTHYGFTLAADMYTPKGAEDRMPAIAVCGPFGAVKEQSSGLYAQTMAERGFVTIAFDPSFTGESSGEPRRTASPDINTEDFMSAVDFLSNQPGIDPERIGIIGICGWGGMALNTAAADPRVKATVASTMYNMSRVTAKGYFDQQDNEESRYQNRKTVAQQRTKDYASGEYPRMGGVVDLNDSLPQFVKDYYDYYRTPRGYHERSGNSTDGWNISGGAALLNMPIMTYINEIRSAVLIMHGEKAHSCYMGRDAFEQMTGVKPRETGSTVVGNKEMLVIPGAVHCDLYDGGKSNYIPFDKLEDFFKSNLK